MPDRDPKTLVCDPVAEQEAIDEFAERRLNARGARTYRDTYQRAASMHFKQASVIEIREELLRAPSPPAPGKDGHAPLQKRKEFEAERRMVAVRLKAIKDAVDRRPASYE
ncbi:hypothetical protein [Planctomyces sp. SH-PL14]|uniref:hypothetical protein n=1 Tax=Planctomyces sp. SH-PL14 TaxID=1632864 RepID=UPI00078C20BE|nr:hypothetical protein [Planctomyces sp. SH-PL14]AMV16978.1 hypothetical protein VT03_03750 [Planctomyces sp. SH-PL14]